MKDMHLAQTYSYGPRTDTADRHTRTAQNIVACTIHQVKSGTGYLQQAVDALLSTWVGADANPLIHEVQALPAAFATVWPKHGMCTEDVHLQQAGQMPVMCKTQSYMAVSLARID